RHARRDEAAGRVDVQVDVPLRVVRIEEQELRDDDVRDFVVDLGAQEHDAVHEQPAEDVIGALAAAGALDNVGRVNLVPGHADSTVDCDRRNVDTFSSVRPRSRSRSRLAFSGAARTSATGAPRRAATSWSFWASSASVARKPWCSTTQSRM